MVNLLLNPASIEFKGSSQNVVANVLDCNIVERKFKFQLCYYIYFLTNALGKGMGLIEPQLFF